MRLTASISVRIVFALAASLLTFQLPSIVSAAEYVPGEIIVKLKGKSNSFEANAFMGKASAQGKLALKSSWKGLNMHHFALKAGQSVESAVQELQQDPSVEYVEPNYVIRLNQPLEDQDRQAPMSLSDVRAQAGALAVTQTSAPIDLSAAWAAETVGLASPIVAVLDTGLDYTHDVFDDSGAVWQNTAEASGVAGVDDDGNGYVDDIRGWNFVSNTNDPYDDDSPGHGTHVSGIILGTTQDIFASPIAAARIKIMPLKFLDSNGSGTTANAVRAIYYAVANGAKVINNSWGGGSWSNSLLEALAYAYTRKVAVVAAAGNSGTNNDVTPLYPASYPIPNIISVAATTDWDTLAGFSNYGASSVHVGGPGLSIKSTLPGNTVGWLSGTSMATPFVSGVAALMVRESPTMNGYQVKQLIFSTSEPIASLSGKVYTNSRINVNDSLVVSKSTSVDPSQPSFDASAASRAPASSRSGSSGAGGCGRVAELASSSEGGAPPIQNLGFFFGLLIMFAPVFLNVYLRSKKTGKSQRKHPRYQISSSVKLKVGDKELVGDVSTISLGGAQLNTAAMLEQGGVVTMTIASPDGKDQIQVQGRVVWREECKSYGVQFANAEESTLAAISRWTQSLVKT